MKDNWDTDELKENFSFNIKEIYLLNNKIEQNKLGFAIIFKFFQLYKKFPESKNLISKKIVLYVSSQLNLNKELFDDYNFNSRSHLRNKIEIRNYFGFTPPTKSDYDNILKWVIENYKFEDFNFESIKEFILERYKELKIEPTTPNKLDRLAKSVIFNYEKTLFENIYNSITDKDQIKIDKLLDFEERKLLDEITFNDLKSSNGKASSDTIRLEINKILLLNELNFPVNILETIPNKIIKFYYQKIASEKLSEIQRYSPKSKYPLTIIFLWIRLKETNDNLIELLISIIHKIHLSAERKIEKELFEDFISVYGKNNILFKIAELAIDNPDGVIKDILYTAIGENIFEDLIKEYKNNGTKFKEKVFIKVSNSYKYHYKKMIRQVLDVLDFESNNKYYIPLIEALEIIKKSHNNSSLNNFYFKDNVPFENIIKNNLKDFIIENEDSIEKISKINYEIVVMQALKEALEIREIWINDSIKYKNPDQDLPKDFEEKKLEYYELLRQPIDPNEFINSIKLNMELALESFNNNISTNKKVLLTEKSKRSWIRLTPFDAQKEAANIAKLKKDILKSWGTINLIDILKETDLQINFTNQFESTTTDKRLSNNDFQRRMLLTLYALGTNTGLKSISTGSENILYEDLIYIKRKFINTTNLKNAISKITNEIIKARSSYIWGDTTTTCASDSKQFAAWDQNLLSEWHNRYKGRGVMIYWHVEKKSACIYSQLKKCSSSEVSSMIEGLLRHQTDAKIEKNYTDTHGQSLLGFALCHLLNFRLMPRLKNIGIQKLNLVEPNSSHLYSNLSSILSNPIKWNLIFDQYDEMIKYVTALRIGTANAESILKKFTRKNSKHPTYKAFNELGKALKTIFLCEYLSSEKLRIEINEGLNVVENWNSANSFIFYGKKSELSSNNIEEQEISALCLHLLQNCLVYVNTIIIEKVLNQDQWENKMLLEDFRALTPLIYSHINPYGNFEIDLNKRINFSMEFE